MLTWSPKLEHSEVFAAESHTSVQSLQHLVALELLAFTLVCVTVVASYLQGGTLMHNVICTDDVVILALYSGGAAHHAAHAMLRQIRCKAKVLVEGIVQTQSRNLPKHF